MIVLSVPAAEKVFLFIQLSEIGISADIGNDAFHDIVCIGKTMKKDPVTRPDPASFFIVQTKFDVL
jgi:hypothetical protein